MKNKSINMLIVGLILLGLMAVMLIVFIEKAHDDFEKNITVNSDGVTESVLSVRNLKLTPTQKSEYSINLVCDASGSYHVSLVYEEKTDGGMKEFVNVLVKYDEKIAYEGTLGALLDGHETIEFESELKSDDPVVITICYEMPYTVGNEAQGTYADFDICLKIEKS